MSDERTEQIRVLERAKRVGGETVMADALAYLLARLDEAEKNMLDYLKRAVLPDALRDAQEQIIALQAQVAQMRRALEDAYGLANSYKSALERTHRGELTDVANDGPTRRRIEAALSSFPVPPQRERTQ